MTFTEAPFLFPCGGDELVGIVSLPSAPSAETGVLVIVGGPQYRAGSHRQFVLLCRHLAAHGIPAMRFDYRSMGDSTGAERGFEAVADDIRAAVDSFIERVPSIDRVVLWGLCDAASAACLYAPPDDRVGGLVLLNPWVRTAAGEAKTYLKHYYVRRAADTELWRKLLTGKLAVRESLAGLLYALRSARRSAAHSKPERDEPADLPSRMAAAVERARRPVLLVLSGRDFVATEFGDVARTRPQWTRIVARASVVRLDEANHTFSTAEWRNTVAEATTAWMAAQGFCAAHALPDVQGILYRS